MRASRICLACACLWLSASAACAQQAQHDSPLKSAMKFLGFATDVNPPADFVEQSRPEKEGDFIPVFRPPPEPKRPVLNEKQLGALKGDLNSLADPGRRVEIRIPAGGKGRGRTEGGGAEEGGREGRRQGSGKSFGAAAIGKLGALYGAVVQGLSAQGTRRIRFPGTRGAHERLSQRAATAALRLRAGQQAQGQGSRRRRRHRRSGHGQPGPVRAEARDRQARRDGRQAAHGPLLGLEGHRRDCAARRRAIMPAASA